MRKKIQLEVNRFFNEGFPTDRETHSMLVSNICSLMAERLEKIRHVKGFNWDKVVRELDNLIKEIKGE